MKRATSLLAAIIIKMTCVSLILERARVHREGGHLVERGYHRRRRRCRHRRHRRRHRPRHRPPLPPPLRDRESRVPD